MNGVCMRFTRNDTDLCGIYLLHGPEKLGEGVVASSRVKGMV